MWIFNNTAKIVGGESGLVADVLQNVNTENNELLVNLQGHQCPENSTTTPLGISGVFTGSGWQDTIDYGMLSVDVVADEDSAVDGLDIQWSVDGVNVIDHDTFTILANTPKTFTFGPARRYYRIVYTNGGTAQTTFSLTSLLRKVYVKPSSHRISDSIVADDDAELVKSILTGLTPGGTFKNVDVTNGGNLKMSLEEYETAIIEAPLPTKDWYAHVAQGLVPGYSLVHKFGRNDAVPNGSWAHVSSTPFALSDFRQSAIAMRVKAGGNANDTSVGGTGARTAVIQGIDSNLNELQEEVSLLGASASAVTTALFWRIHRAWVSGVGTYGGANVADVIIEDSGSGADFIKIVAGEGQTQYAGWTVPTGKKAYLVSVHVTVDSNKTANIRCMTRENFNDVSGTMSPVRLKLFWDGLEQSFDYKPKYPEFEMSALTDIWFEAYGDGAVSSVSVDFELLVVDE